MKYHLLLLEDIVNHGRKGELVHAAPGFARNFLLPQGKAVLASRATVRMREKLQKEREEQASKDRQESLALAEKLKDKVLDTVVKVDPDGHMYGSVTSTDIAKILEGNGYKVDKRCVSLHHPIRSIGTYQVTLKLPEEVEAIIGLEVKPDRKIEKKKAAKKEAKEEGDAEVEAKAAEESSQEKAPEENVQEENKEES